jgi:hypothetical protein
MIYQCRHFKLKELFPPDMLETPEAILWQLLDPRVLMAADALRDEFGPAWCNTGDLTQRGWRHSKSATGAKWSQHKYGRALDLTFKNANAETVRQSIRQKRGTYRMITCIERDVSWVHIDCRNYDGLMEVNP